MPRNPSTPMRRWLSVALGAALAATTLVGAAQVYKWRDAEGVVHYGDRPPTGTGTRVDIDAHGGPAQGDAAAPHGSPEREALPGVEGQPVPASEAGSSAADPAKRDEACAQARAKLEQFADGWRFYELDGQGERKWLTEAERTTAEARWRKEVEAWCKGQPAGGSAPARARPPRGQPVP